ncbi:MAG: dynamin family protein [Pseudomonadota bacterium]
MTPETQRKPRIALMGEFSAGKSTLSNLLLGARPLPERVTATRLSPVWIAQGNPAAHRELLDGSEESIEVAEIGDVPIEDTRVIRLFMQADMLENCDLIDCPGISDPNMPSEVWERLVPEIDAVIWCTHATQAWRQSEASVWEAMPEALRENSILLVTRFDKLTSDKDRRRVMARVERETNGQFDAVFPISLTNALAAGDDPERWEASGAHDFAEHLVDMISRLSVAEPAGKDFVPLDTGPKTLVLEPSMAVDETVAEPVKAVEGTVVPRRIRPAASEKSQRPPKRARPTGEKSSVRPLRPATGSAGLPDGAALKDS